MNAESLPAHEYATRFKQAIQKWMLYAVRSAWVLTFVDADEENDNQLRCLEKVWKELDSCITEQNLTLRSGKLIDEIKMAFLDPLIENELLKNNKGLDESIGALNGEIRKHCYNIMVKTLSQWELKLVKNDPSEKLDIRSFWIKKLSALEDMGELDIVFRHFIYFLNQNESEITLQIHDFITFLIERDTAHPIEQAVEVKSAMAKSSQDARVDAAKRIIAYQQELEKVVDYYGVLYAAIKLDQPLIQELMDYQETLRCRKNAYIKMPWWDLDAIECEYKFLKRILALNNNSMLSPSTLKEALREDKITFNGYFNRMRQLYKKIEDALKNEITRKARTQDDCPEIELPDKQLLHEIQEAFQEKYDCAATPKFRSPKLQSRQYHYDVYDNNFSSPENHQHSRGCGRKQKKEYYYQALGKESDGKVKLSHLVQVRESLCCFAWKLGSRNPVIHAHSTNLADRVESCLANTLWKLSTGEINSEKKNIIRG